MTDKSKPEELTKTDLDGVQGGYTKVEWERSFTATDDLAKVTADRKDAQRKSVMGGPISNGHLGSER